MDPVVILCITLFIALPLAAVPVAYWLGYRAGKVVFVRSITSMGFPALILLVLIIGSASANKELLPVCHFDERYNERRSEKGLPPIENDWALLEDAGNRYLQVYASPCLTQSYCKAHTRKIVSYNWLGPCTETDLFRHGNEWLLSSYDYSSGKFCYLYASAAGTASLNLQIKEQNAEEFNNVLNNWIYTNPY